MQSPSSAEFRELPIPPQMIQLKKWMIISREVVLGVLNERKPQNVQSWAPPGLELETSGLEGVCYLVLHGG